MALLRNLPFVVRLPCVTKPTRVTAKSACVSTIHPHNTRQIGRYRAPLARCFQRSSALKCSGSKIKKNLISVTNYNCTFSTLKYEMRAQYFELNVWWWCSTHAFLINACFLHDVIQRFRSWSWFCYMFLNTRLELQWVEHGGGLAMDGGMYSIQIWMYRWLGANLR